MEYSKFFYIHTPFVNNSKYIPHLVEHACFGGMTEEKFLRIERQTEAYVKGPITVLKINTRENSTVEEIINTLCKPLDPAIIHKEEKTLRNELSQSTYYQRLYESIGKKIIKKDFDNTKSHRVAVNDIIQYHAQYYQVNNFYNPENVSEITKIGKIVSPEKIKLIFEGTEYCIEYQENSSVNLVISFLRSEFRNDWLRFYLRYIKNIYRYEECSSFYYESFCVSVIPKTSIQPLGKITSDFRTSWQKYSKESISSGLWKNVHFEYYDFLGASATLFGKIPSTALQLDLIDYVVNETIF